MAKKTADVFGTRMKAVASELGTRQADLQKLQDQLRDDPMNADLRRQVQDAKRALGPLTEEYGFLARAVSMQAGGTSFSPEPG